MDTIFIRQLKVHTVIGVFPVERQFKQTLLLDLDLATDALQIAQTDSMKDAVDYASIATFIHAFATDNSFHMIETFAQRLSEQLSGTFSLRGHAITVYKPGAVLTAHTVGIRIQRGELS
jgi:dihydroneopterin aldolase